MSLFITFEGGEGSGKSIQAKALFRKLSQESIPAVLTQEPGGTSLGKDIARKLKWSENKNISPMTELMLFNASRAQLVEEVISPALKDGKVVICDRFYDSTTAYQGYGRGLDLEMVQSVNQTAARGVKPDVTFLLNLPTEHGFSRKNESDFDRFEKEASHFHKKVLDGYLKLASQEPGRWLVIDATKDKDEISDTIWHRVKELLPHRGA